MMRAFAAWKWSLGVVARSYRTVVVLAALIALWVFLVYEWLGLPESSALLLILALLWVLVQLLATVVILGATVSGAADAADTDRWNLPLRSLWTLGRKQMVSTLMFTILSFVLVWLCLAVFGWINGHSVEVASFLTFHLQKPVSYMLIDQAFRAIELILWAVVGGFLLSLFITLLRGGWGAAGKQSWKLLAGCAYRAPFLASLLSVVVFGGIAYELASWHPKAAAGFWDYTQMIVRFSLALILISAGGLFWSLSLARLTLPNSKPSGTC